MMVLQQVFNPVVGHGPEGADAMRRRMGRLAALAILAALSVAATTSLGWPPAQKVILEQPREDLARDKPATASTFQSDDKGPFAAFDGDPETRWCASDASAPQWLQVDLGRPETITGYRLVWESGDVAHPHKIEGSLDGKTWSFVAEVSDDRTKYQDRSIRLPAEVKSIRHVRLNVTETEPDHWASLFTFEVYGTRPAQAPGKASARKSDDRNILRGIKAPEGFELSAFASPPDVRYPTCLAASPEGVVFVGIDENGSLDAKTGRGRVVRCIDSDGDGKADKFNVFASMDSPRGVIWDAGTLYVLHPPFLSSYTDTNGDGVSDKSEDLVKGIGFDLKFRGADHTTNGIRLGIDGYIYVAVGDYGFVKAEGKDGKPLQLLGGGIVRVRTDGTGLEIVSRGQRNIYDVAIDPYMNLFTRDNTNDGDGWDVRLSHVVPTGHYGYPSLFKRFPDEHIQPLADYGGGSPCGSLYLQEPSLPAPYGDMLYTCEWGRGGIFMHPLTPNGAGFKADQKMFLEIPRPTDMDVDGAGRIYVSSWRDGGFNYSRPDIGYVIRLVPKGLKPAKFPELKPANDEQLVEWIVSNSAVLRLAGQRELLRRGVKTGAFRRLTLKAWSDREGLPGRVAALFTMSQSGNPEAIDQIRALVSASDVMAEAALKALGDHGSAITEAMANPLVKYLADPNPSVRLQAAIAFGKFGQVDKASAILPLTADPDPIVAHVAVKALVALNALDDCLKALGDPKLAPGASMALQAMHDPKVIAGLVQILEGSSRDLAKAKPALKALCRLYFTEAPYEAGQWWGTRPDTSGPYYKAVTWKESEAVGEALKGAVKLADEPTRRWLLGEMLKNKVDFEETTALALKLSSTDPALKAASTDLLVSRPKLSLDAIKFLEGVATVDADPSARAKALRGLIRHTSQQESRESALRVLALISMQDEPLAEPLGVWLDYAKDGRHARDAGTFVKMAEGADPGRGVLGYAVLIQIGDNRRTPEASRTDAEKAIERAWSKPESTPRLLRAIALSKANAYAPKVKSVLADSHNELKQAAEFAARRLNIALKAEPTASTKGVKAIAATPYDQVLAAVLKDKGDAALGATLFEKQGCVNCHAVAKGQPIKGPYLGDITTRYNRTELTESILKPSAKIAQGFETKKFELSSGQSYEGFVVREAGDEIEMRNSSGAVSIISKKDIEATLKSEVSVMPQGLLDPLTPHDLASLLAYLESLKGK
jgi:putative membrane-bound dehydrogenase-like protein